MNNSNATTDARLISALVRALKSENIITEDAAQRIIAFSLDQIEILPTETTDAAQWDPWERVGVGTVRIYDGQQYRCKQDHVTQTDWTPDKTLTLWEPITGQQDGYPVWVYGMTIAVGDIVWNVSKTQLYKALQAQAPSIWEPGSAGTSAIWQKYNS